MANPNSSYQSPLQGRYASPAMLKLFSNDTRYGTWRRLWVALAEIEMELGLPVTQEQINEMEAHLTDIDYELAAQKEQELRHDVMAHVHTYGELCPKAMPIIHLGATSCYVGDNTDIIVMRQGLELVRKKLIGVLAKLAKSPSMLSTRSRRLAMAVEPSPMRLAMFCNCFCISAAVWPKLGRFSLESALETTPTARCACWRARMVSWLLYPESSFCNAWILSPKSS